MITPIASLQFAGAYPNLTVHNGTLYCATGGNGIPWTLHTIANQGGHQWIVVAWREYGQNCAGPAQEIRPGVFCWHEMTGARWPRFDLDLSTGLVAQVGDTMPSSQIICRDGSVLSVIADPNNGRAELNSILIADGDVGRGDFCNGHTLLRRFSNMSMRRVLADGAWEEHAAQTSGGILDAVIQPSGDVVYTFGSEARVWFSDGVDGPLSLAPWASKSAAWAWSDAVLPWTAYAAFHPPSDNLCFLTPIFSNLALTLNRGTQDSHVRTAMLSPNLCAVATWHSYQQPATTTIDIVDLNTPLTVPVEPGGPIDPPDPEEPDMDTAAILKKLGEIETKVDELAEAERVRSLASRQEFKELDRLAKAVRTGTVGSLFGTQQLALREQK